MLQDATIYHGCVVHVCRVVTYVLFSIARISYVGIGNTCVDISSFYLFYLGTYFYLAPYLLKFILVSGGH